MQTRQRGDGGGVALAPLGLCTRAKGQRDLVEGHRLRVASAVYQTVSGFADAHMVYQSLQ
jgi:hypothetical protein